MLNVAEAAKNLSPVDNLHTPKATKVNDSGQVRSMYRSFLPLNFQAAISISRHLGIEDSCIDALVIFQEPEARPKRCQRSEGPVGLFIHVR